jgi:Tfp pilus assembly protein PilF
MRRALLALPLLLATTVAPTACGPASGPQGSQKSPAAAQWTERAKASYRSGDFDDAREAVRHALAAAPTDPEIRELGARVALVRLDYAEALKLTEGLESSAVHALRGRALWFSGDIEHAADELETLLSDPQVKDPWAHEVAALARRGAGRHPFEMEGASVAAVEMPKSIDRVPLGAADVVPCELDGEQILALVATGSSEVLVDSNSRHEPSWVSLRIDRIEVKDVPALTQDLSALARQIGVPIKALLGTQFLRHAHVTFDRRGDQFVVRRQDAPAPPDATGASRVPLYYIRGGGMVFRASVTPAAQGTSADNEPIPLFVDSARPFPLALQDAAWQKAGVDVKSLVAVPDMPGIKHGTVPTFRVGGFDLPKMPALEGGDLADFAGVDVDLGGVAGADLLSFFRMTFEDEGRFVWIEPDPSLLVAPPPQAPAQAPASATPTPAAPPPTSGPAPAPAPTRKP